MFEYSQRTMTKEYSRGYDDIWWKHKHACDCKKENKGICCRTLGECSCEGEGIRFKQNKDGIRPVVKANKNKRR
jgi:hypothetical protein